MGEQTDSIDVVREFWRLMNTNRFEDLAQVLATHFVLEWPLSNERIVGAERFIQMNQEYPAYGRWRFTIHKLVASGCDVVTDVTVTDGVQTARAISFFTVEAGRITKLVEFWPDPSPPQPNRAHLVEPITPDPTEPKPGQESRL